MGNIHLVMTIIVFAGLSCTSSHAGFLVANARKVEVEQVELRPIDNNKLSFNGPIADIYIRTGIDLKSTHDADILGKNIDIACDHDVKYYGNGCSRGDDLECYRQFSVVNACESARSALSLRRIDLDSQEKLKEINERAKVDPTYAAHGSGNTSNNIPTYSAPPVYVPQPVFVPSIAPAPSYSNSGWNGGPACQNRCTTTWISCDKACEVAPNFGKDPTFYDRQSACHAQCRQSYSMCQQGC